MKRYYFSKNKFTSEYSLDEGTFGMHRTYLGKISVKEVIKYLKFNLNLKRENTNFYVVGEIGEEVKLGLEKLFENSKINLEFRSEKI